MPNKTDFSDYFTILGLPETISRTPSDTLNTSESLSKAVSTWKTVRSTSDTLTTQDSSLTRSVSLFRVTRSLNDTQSLSESFNKSVETWRDIRALTNTLNSSESLSRSIGTWKNVLSFNMTINLAESLSKSTQTWRDSISNNESISLSDSLSLQVETWQHVNSPSDTLSLGDSFSKSVDAWFIPNTKNDTLSLSDGVTIQTTLTNDTYYYDSYGMDRVGTLIGHVSSGNFTSDTNRVVNHKALYDNGVNIPTIFKGSQYSSACVVFDFASQVPVDFCAIFVQSLLTNPITIYGSNSQGTGYTSINTLYGSSNSWQISETNEHTYRYFAVQIENMSADVKIGEVLIGNSFKPSVRYDTNSTYGYKTDNKINESHKGIEYAYKTSELKKIFERKYPNISNSLKTKFESFWNYASHKKTLYYFDSEIFYVSSTKIDLSEIAHNRYSTSYNLSE